MKHTYLPTPTKYDAKNECLANICVPQSVCVGGFVGGRIKQRRDST